MGLRLSQLVFSVFLVPAQVSDFLFKLFDGSGGLDEIAMKTCVLLLQFCDGAFVMLEIGLEIFHDFLDLLVVFLMPFLFLLQPPLQFMNLLLINRHLLHVGLLLHLRPGIQFHDFVFVSLELSFSDLPDLLLLTVQLSVVRLDDLLDLLFELLVLVL